MWVGFACPKTHPESKNWHTCCRFGRSSEWFFDLPIAENDAPRMDKTDAQKIFCKRRRRSEYQIIQPYTYESEFRGLASACMSWGVRGCTAWFSRRAVPSALAIKTHRKQRGPNNHNSKHSAHVCTRWCAIFKLLDTTWNCLYCIGQVINCVQNHCANLLIALERWATADACFTAK